MEHNKEACRIIGCGICDNHDFSTTPTTLEWEKEFDGCYSDLFTESNDCTGCKNSFEGDTRHRRHCIVDIKDFIRSLLTANTRETLKNAETAALNAVPASNDQMHIVRAIRALTPQEKDSV